MKENRLLYLIGDIDDRFIETAEFPEQQAKANSAKSKRNIYAFGSVAAAAVITIGSVAFYNANSPSKFRNDSLIIQSDNSDDNTPIKDSSIVSTSSGTEKTTDSSEKTTAKEETEVTCTDNLIDNDSENDNMMYVDDNQTQQTTSDSNTSQITQPHTEEHKGGVDIENCYYRPFAPTIDPDSDAFGEDEYHHVDIRTADGLYHQLGLDEYAANNISSVLSIADFGGYIGKIVEVNDSRYYGNSVESQEPTLAGADVYYYALTGKNKAYIIVKLMEQCSIFIADNITVSDGFKNGLAFFDVQSAEDIQSIEYRINVPDGFKMVTSVKNTITDAATISDIYELLCQLTPEDYSKLSEYIGTPRWLVDAWENYNSDPDAPEKEDYRIIIKLKDGLVLQEIHYQPYLGNGYVENMQELTPEQNNTLKELLK